MRRWIETADAEQPLNLVVANAGAALGAATVAGLQDAASKSFEVNVGGVFNTVHPALELMARRRPYPVCDAQVAIMSSIMGYLGTARSPAYSSSKAAVKAYGEALRGALRNLGIGVSVICPGYVASGMINRPMPFIIPAERAAAIIAGGLARNQARITFPWQVRWLGRLVECLPNRLVDRFNRPWGVPGLEEQPEMENDT
jgi:NAD(P)-dependent dehydrogenase (short-subunit alcohol dehydrogenase family)